MAYAMTTLFQHQKDFLTANPDKTSLIWSCGTGKSRAAIEWSNLRKQAVLIICPKALKVNWQREAERWGMANPNPASNCFCIMSKEEFRKCHKETFRFDQVIVDEVHNGFLTPLFKSQMSKALKWYLKKHKVPRVLLLTATPYTASPWNIFNLAHYTGHNWNYKTYEQTFFYHVRMGFRMIPQVKKGSEAKLAKLVQKIASVVRIEDVMDVPLQNHTEPEYFALSKEQERAIKDNYDPLPIVRYTAQHEIENGFLYGNEFREKEVYFSDKLERIFSLIEENPKVAIVCRYNYQIDCIRLNMLAMKKNVFVIRGDVKDRDAVTLAAEKAEKAIVLIQADCGVGFQLPSFSLCIYASMSYSYTAWEQMNGRFLRMDKPSPTTFVYLLTDGDSIDQAVYDCVQKKSDFKIALYKQ